MEIKLCCKGGFRGGPRGPGSPFSGLLLINISALTYGIQEFAKFKRPKCTRLHLIFLKSYWAITAAITSISKIFPEQHAHEIPAKSASFAVLMGPMALWLFCQSNLIAFLPSSLPSPSSLLKLTISEPQDRRRKKTANLVWQACLPSNRSFCKSPKTFS